MQLINKTVIISGDSKKCQGNFKNRIDFKAIKKRLKDGNKRYVKDKPLQPNQSKERRECTEKNNQKPFAIVLSCADSRVPPELIFDTGIGDLFVWRVAGNIADTYNIVNIEFTIKVLKCQ
ncbi:carbonic anhydrase [Kordia sp.]|uniref:carbonic anhydrase n=1 Tax=Kordia sp. TaxID=1965332 RepID=UPI0025B7D632|nr:carbonic anhydrase [Kordia sp.]MCH2195029.1 hypothetical protein [Kordia sp.]